jgi:hypothetical protein
MVVSAADESRHPANRGRKFPPPEVITEAEVFTLVRARSNKAPLASGTVPSWPFSTGAVCASPRQWRSN